MDLTTHQIKNENEGHTYLYYVYFGRLSFDKYKKINKKY